MITLFAEGTKTRVFTPQFGCSVFASDKSMTHQPGKFLGIVSKIDGNQLHVKFGEVTNLYLWKFANGNKNEWLEFGP